TQGSIVALSLQYLVIYSGIWAVFPSLENRSDFGQALLHRLRCRCGTQSTHGIVELRILISTVIVKMKDVSNLIEADTNQVIEVKLCLVKFVEQSRRLERL